MRSWQTADGYLWIGTQAGLARFDGVDFAVFDAGNSPLSTESVLALHEDADGWLWIGTSEGPLRMRSGVFETFDADESAPPGRIRALHQDSVGRVWILGDGELVVYQDGRFDAVRDGDGHSVSRSTSIVEAERRNDLDHRGGRLSVQGATSCVRCPAPQAFEPRHRAWPEPTDDRLWVGTSGDGLYVLGGDEIEHFTVRDGLPDPFITTLSIDSAGNLWIGTMGGGVARYAKGAMETLPSEVALEMKSVVSIVEDREANLWIGTNGGGLHRFKDGVFSTFASDEGLEATSTSAILEDREGALWIGSMGQGVFRYRDDQFTSFTTSNGLSTDVITSIAEDSAGALWFGGIGGLSRYDANRLYALRH